MELRGIKKLVGATTSYEGFFKKTIRSSFTDLAYKKPMVFSSQIDLTLIGKIGNRNLAKHDTAHVEVRGLLNIRE